MIILFGVISVDVEAVVGLEHEVWVKRMLGADAVDGMSHVLALTLSIEVVMKEKARAMPRRCAHYGVESISSARGIVYCELGAGNPIGRVVHAYAVATALKRQAVVDNTVAGPTEDAYLQLLYGRYPEASYEVLAGVFINEIDTLAREYTALVMDPSVAVAARGEEIALKLYTHVAAVGGVLACGIIETGQTVSQLKIAAMA